MILIFYAFGREVAALKRKVKARSALRAGGLRGFRATLGGIEICAVATGIGPERARAAARRAFETLPRPKLVVSTGVAGALSEGLEAGDIVIADRFVWADGSRPTLPLGAELLQWAQSAMLARGIRFAAGAMLTSERVLASAAEKRRAKSETGAIAVDMESAALASEALARDLPFTCVRAILDSIADDLVFPGLPDGEGRVNPLKAGAALIRNPAMLVRLPPLMRKLARASNSLAEALDALSRELR